MSDNKNRSAEQIEALIVKTIQTIFSEFIVSEENKQEALIAVSGYFLNKEYLKMTTKEQREKFLELSMQMIKGIK